MATPNLGWENQVENTLQPGVAFNLLADDADAAIAGCVAVDFDADGNLTLDRGQWMTSVLALTDDDEVLTGAVEVIFPAAFPCMLVVNGTAQALTLTNGDTDEVTLPAGDSVRISAGPAGVLADPSGSGGGGIPDAPSDGNLYGRKDGDWEQVTGGGGGSDVIAVQTPANSSGTVTLDFDSKSRYVGAITLGANVTTLAFSNLPGAGNYAEYELHISQDGTGSRTFAIPASHRALGGSDTAIASAANAVTVLTASTVNNGTTWRYAMQESA